MLYIKRTSGAGGQWTSGRHLYMGLLATLFLLAGCGSTAEDAGPVVDDIVDSVEDVASTADLDGAVDGAIDGATDGGDAATDGGDDGGDAATTETTAAPDSTTNDDAATDAGDSDASDSDDGGGLLIPMIIVGVVALLLIGVMVGRSGNSDQGSGDSRDDTNGSGGSTMDRDQVQRRRVNDLLALSRWVVGQLTSSLNTQSASELASTEGQLSERILEAQSNATALVSQEKEPMSTAVSSLAQSLANSHTYFNDFVAAAQSDERDKTADSAADLKNRKASVRAARDDLELSIRRVSDQVPYL